MILGRGEATRGREGVVDEEDRVGKEGRKEGRPELGSLRHGKSALTEATGTNGLNFIFCNTLAVPQPVLGHPRTCDLFHRAVSLANAIQPVRHYYYASALISSSLFSRRLFSSSELITGKKFIFISSFGMKIKKSS